MATPTIRPAVAYLAMLLGAGFNRTAAAQQDTTWTEAVIRLDVIDGPSEVVPALARDSILLLPVQRFLQLAEIRLTELTPGRALAATMEPGSLVVRFEPDSHRVIRGRETLPLRPVDAAWWNDELYASTAVMARAFAVTFAVNWGDLAVAVGQTNGLPVVRRARRERQRAMVFRPVKRPAPSILAAPIQRTLADGAVFEWSATTPTRDPLNRFTLHLGLGAEVLGGGLELRHDLQRLISGTDHRLTGAWARAWPEQPWLRQVRLGDVFSGGRRSRNVRGAVVTNEPFIRSSEFDVEEVVGRLPPGWEIELYDGHRLLDYGEVDASGEFRVAFPVRYGPNPFDMVAYGPAGEVVRRHRTVRVPFARLPAGRFEYSIGGGTCRSEPCTAVFTAGARYGISSRLTAQVGQDLFWIDGRRELWQPHGSLTAAVLPSLGLTIEGVVRGLARGRAEFEPTPDLRADLSHTVFAQSGAALSGALLEHRRTEASVFWRPGGPAGTIFFQGSALYATGPDTRRDAARLALTARRGSVRYTLGFRRDGFDRVGSTGFSQTLFDVSGDAVLRGPTPLRSAVARGALTLDPRHGVSVVLASVSRRIPPGIQLDVGAGWVRQGGLVLDLAVSTALPGPRFGSRNRFSSQTGAEGIQFADGSLVWEREAGRVRPSKGRDLGRAGVAGDVFLDLNANGLRESDEPGMPAVPVRVGGWAVTTDSTGHFAAWDLYPFEASIIEVDTLSLGDPMLAAAAPAIRVHPTPNSFVSIEIPIVVGAELSGTVTLEGEPLAGATVTLRHTTTGAIRSLMTFTDGGFYAIGVPPGEYDLGVPDEVLQSLKAAVIPIRVVVPAGRGEKRFDDLLIQLVIPPDQLPEP